MRGMRFSTLALFAALFAALVSAPGGVPAGDTDFTHLAQARYVHCAFYKAYETDPATGGPIMVEGRADSLVHFQNVDVKRAKARAIYTRKSGSHEVTVIQPDKAIHFIENVAGMYLAARVDGMKTLAGLFGRAHSALKLFRT